MLPLTLATEDALSEAVALRLLADFPAITIGASLRRGETVICGPACVSFARLRIIVPF
jgi:hypothetical protein